MKKAKSITFSLPASKGRCQSASPGKAPSDHMLLRRLFEDPKIGRLQKKIMFSFVSLF